MRQYPFYLALILCCAITGIHAEPRISIQTQYYDVYGTNISQIYKSLQGNGPSGSDGKRYHARTSWQLNWGYQWIGSELNCRLTRIDIETNIDYLLPRLVTAPDISQTLQDKWNHYYEALFQHEQRHKDYGVAASRELEQVLNELTPLPCNELDQLVANIAQGILDRYEKQEREFDKKTDHGKNQGVILR